MRILAIIGVLLILFGIAALAFQGFTFFTTERVVDAGPFHVDVNHPHTIIFHPVAGILAIIAGLVMVVVGARTKTT
jgi:drug/metabolite transporter (DMT)-like permease